MLIYFDNFPQMIAFNSTLQFRNEYLELINTASISNIVICNYKPIIYRDRQDRFAGVILNFRDRSI